MVTLTISLHFFPVGCLEGTMKFETSVKKEEKKIKKKKKKKKTNLLLLILLFISSGDPLIVIR